jgi:hypothetical protein
VVSALRIDQWGQPSTRVGVDGYNLSLLTIGPSAGNKQFLSMAGQAENGTQFSPLN